MLTWNKFSSNFQHIHPLLQFLTLNIPIYLSKSIIKPLRRRCEIYSKLTIKTPERSQWPRSGVFIVNFKHISHIFSQCFFCWFWTGKCLLGIFTCSGKCYIPLVSIPNMTKRFWSKFFTFVPNFSKNIMNNSKRNTCLNSCDKCIAWRKIKSSP